MKFPTPNVDDSSDEQIIVPTVVGMCSGLLSVIGSTTIVIKILRGFESITTYDRIMLGMSAYDIISSITLAISEFLAPKETQRVWAFGNQATCKANGSLDQFIAGSLWYSAMLSLYFLLSVISQLRQKDFVRKSEVWMHLSGLYFPITALMGPFLGWYGWIDLEGDCGVIDPVIGGINVIMFLLSVFLVIVDYGLIFALVRKALRSKNPMPRQKRIKRETTVLMFLYVGALFVVWAPWLVAFVVLIMSLGYTKSEIYPAVVLYRLTLPLQGFLNAFIYFKPAYTRFRVAYPNKSRRFVLYQTLFGLTGPETTHRHRDANRVTQGSVYVNDVTTTELPQSMITDRPDYNLSNTSNISADEDEDVGITGVDFESTMFFTYDENAASENNVSPMENVAEENDGSPDSNL